ncbi:MAG: glycerol-3-phosphate dehydrogenase/oxidase [Candidatus Marinimicrobia bacterium]|jgi:glycerol-3-phosphate dehydrogenase|nr:glycerol-3-phosphate dehydrogenase/oxidase [Candidatus Neomarinimicrobiota bacterium]MBT3632359.1 glycerol-3-phosphate dehydrogenase/oxidase [Candidatus Neomarinimicrobiota bacterium]MBT3825807.1 glycerol-3-phosphate dehydrogenase/oxidase [Candidatus Neomarinimicrobiota bacterium]MBT4129771.1 glycerol-3-phosphate dehydrogenase/oxidase [Candidatus Neomarinimicrobiota bacterium]MBT4294188.1 glycerol-3-phosphate dehydrogenase/oxidase [Candidatus Neomarinimicrobiota bacterium]
MQNYDVIVLGAGINGCGIAENLAQSGKQVLLLDKEGVGQGTSSKSSRLIHGGLRYLETGQIHLVYEALHDRQRLISKYPGLVEPRRFILPIYKSSPRPAWMIRIGLWMYDLLSGSRKVGRSQTEDISTFKSSFPAFIEDGLTSVLSYVDAKTHDRELTRRVADDFQKLGGTVIVHCEIESVHWNNEGFELRSSTGDFSAPVLVNATGPWLNEVNEKFDLPARFQIRKVSGIHLIFDGLMVPELMFMQTREKRIFFIIPEPENDQTLIGTTEREEDCNMDDLHAQESDIQYLLDQVNAYLKPDHQFQRKDVRDIYIGVRPLVRRKGDVTDVSREYKLDLHTRGDTKLLHIFGGKLTTYLSLAENVAKVLGVRS